MKLKSVILLFLICLFNIAVGQENPKYEVGVNANLIIGGDYLSSYNMTIGAEGKYYFLHKDKWHAYGNLGAFTTLNGEGSSLFGINLGAGVQYDLINVNKKPIFLDLGVGALYTHEKFSTDVADITNDGISILTVDSSFDEIDFTGKFGIGYRWSEKINTQVNISILGSNARAVGLGISYRF